MKKETSWQDEEKAILLGSDPALDLAFHAGNMREALREEQDDLRVRQYALQVKMFYLKLDPVLAKTFVMELTGDPHGDWRELFEHLAKISSPPPKRRNPSYEKSKAYYKTLVATRNYDSALKAACRAYEDAKEWNEFLDKKQQPAPALPPAKTPPALEIGKSASGGTCAAGPRQADTRTRE